MDYLGALRMFVRAVEVRSFSKAAVATNAKTSTVSRAIASLEEDLGVSLFHRTTHRAQLTEPSATFYEHARSILRRLEEARDAASAMDGRIPACYPASSRRTGALSARARPICAARRQSPSRSICCCTIVLSIRCSRPIVGSFVIRTRQRRLSSKSPSPARCALTTPSRCAMRRLPALGSCSSRHGWSARISRRVACGTCFPSGPL
jgi:hypothetical protein